MKREFLRGLGIEEEAIKKILDEHHDDLEKYRTKPESAETLQAQLDAAYEEIANRDTQISNLQESAKGNEQLTKELEDIKADNEGYKEKLAKVQLDNAVKLAVAKDAVNPEHVLMLMGTDDLSLNEQGEVVGLDDKLKDFRENNTHLFTKQVKTGTTPQTGDNPNTLTRDEILAISDPTERYEKINENIHLFE